jgi:hypothetical protein
MKLSVEHSLKDFMWQHIDLAMTKGFDDNVGRNPVSALFEVICTVNHKLFQVAVLNFQNFLNVLEFGCHKKNFIRGFAKSDLHFLRDKFWRSGNVIEIDHEYYLFTPVNS